MRLGALEKKETITVMNAIYEKWICVFGVPLEITADQGSEFCSKLSKELGQKLKIEHNKTSPYNPKCNSQAEVVNKTIAKYLTDMVDASTLDWTLYLAPLAFSYNTSLHETTRVMPFELTYGLLPRLPSIPAPDVQRMYGED